MALSSRKSGTSEREFRVFLFNIAREITDELLDILKFLCKDDDLAKGEIDSTKTARDFLELLWKGDKISPADVGYLTGILETAGYIQLANLVKEREPRRKSNLPCQSDPFVGRNDVVDEIMEKVRSVAVRVIIIIGLPGMGKTEVAIRVGHLLQKQDCPIVYVEKQKNFMEICDEILFQLDHRHWTLNNDIVLHAKRKLSELNEDIIIILDNTDDAQEGDDFEEFVKFLVKFAPKVRTVITTQHDIKRVVSYSIHKIRLEPLDPASSAELLMRLTPGISQCYAEEIGRLCGGVPFFLVSCTCSMLADGFCPDVFIQELRQNPVRMFKDSEPLNQYYEDMGRFFRLFPQEVLRNLVRLSVFANAFSPSDILFMFNDEYELQVVKTKMIQCCLIKKSSGSNLLAVHPLLKSYCRAERESLSLVAVGNAAEWDFNHHFLDILKDLHKQFIRKDSSSEAIQRFRAEKANIMEAFKNCFHNTSELKEKVFAVDIGNEVVDFLVKVLSPPKECTKLYKKCCEFARDSSDEKRLADSLNSIGFRCLDDAAHCEGEGAIRACQMFQEAYDIFKRLPEEMQKCETHAHVTTKLGLCVLFQGDVTRGRQLINEGITLRQELGVELYVAAGNCDLGHSYRHCGHYKNALDVWLTKTLPIYKVQLGVHPWTASILQHIASIYLEFAREDPSMYADLAETYTREALQMRQELLGLHQDTARSHVSLSDVFIIQGRLDLALDGLEMALEIQEDVLGIHQQDTIDTFNKLIDVLGKSGREHEAENRRRCMSEQLSQNAASKFT